METKNTQPFVNRRRQLRANMHGPASKIVSLRESTQPGTCPLWVIGGHDRVRSDDATTLIHITLEGSRAVSTAALPTAPAMPAFSWRLNGEQITSVLTFIRNTWGNSASKVSADTVRKSFTAGRQ